MEKMLLMLCVLFVLESCDPDTEVPAPVATQYQGKVLFDVCGNIAVQFTDGTARGQMGWRRDGDSIVYNNVFRVANPCTWGWDGRNNDIVFTFVAPVPQQCAQCLAWTATPDIAYNIRVVK